MCLSSMSLIEKAKQIPDGRKQKFVVDSDVISLTIAYIRKEITGKQYTSALDISHGSANHTASCILRKAWEIGLVRIELL
jgi:hypothetical protein